MLAEHLLVVAAALDGAAGAYLGAHHAMDFHLLEFLDVVLEDILVLFEKGDVYGILFQVPLKSLAFLAGSSRGIGL